LAVAGGDIPGRAQNRICLDYVVAWQPRHTGLVLALFMQSISSPVRAWLYQTRTGARLTAIRPLPLRPLTPRIGSVGPRKTRLFRWRSSWSSPRRSWARVPCTGALQWVFPMTS